MALRFIVGALLAATAWLGAPMAFGKSFVLCSEFVGQLVSESGQPVSGVRLERTWEWAWNGESGTDVAESAADGRFRFPEVTGRSLFASLMPHEPSITQQIIARRPNGPLTIWYSGKLNYDRNGELGRPLDMICHIDREPQPSRWFEGVCEERTKPR
jgi:hypothetical protein